MAWNIVIAGGGFGGLAAARELEKVMPKQSARLMLVNETNYSTYSPFLPEAAAGTLEPRHVVTPLREILKRTYLRLGSIVSQRPLWRSTPIRNVGGSNRSSPARRGPLMRAAKASAGTTGTGSPDGPMPTASIEGDATSPTSFRTVASTRFSGHGGSPGPIRGGGCCLAAMVDGFLL